MPYDIEFVGTQRRSSSDISDIIDYFFRISNGETHRDVAVGITGQSINPVGLPPRTGEELSGVATGWLRLNLDRGFDPFSDSSARIADLPGTVIDYWVENGHLPPSLLV